MDGTEGPTGDAAVASTALPPPPTEGSTPILIGWRTAVARALLAVVALGALAEIVVFVAYQQARGTKPALGDVARIGGLLFFLFDRVGVSAGGAINGDLLGQGGTGQVQLSATITFAILGATLLAGLLLAYGGRSIGRQAGGSRLARGLHGTKVAIPYALVCFATSFAVRFVVPTPELFGDSVTLHASYAAALLWPLVIGAVAGFAGGLSAGGEWAWGDTLVGRDVRAAVAGGWRMVALGLAFSFAGLLVMAVVQPHDTGNYFSGAFEPGAGAGITVLMLTALAIPNMASWVLFPSMGACIGASGGAAGASVSVCAVSWTHFPGGPTPLSGTAGLAGFNGQSPPTVYFLFVLAPLLAVLLGGMIAARRASAPNRGHAAAVGASAGVAFAIFALALAILSGIVARVSGGLSASVSSGSFRIGPDLVGGPLLAMAWGVVGGALGAALAWRPRPLEPGAGTWVGAEPRAELPVPVDGPEEPRHDLAPPEPPPEHG